MSCCSNRIFLVGVGCLAVGAAVGYFARIMSSSPDAEPIPDVPVAVTTVADRKATPAAAGENAECRKLREKVKRLERELDGMAKVDGRAQGESDSAPWDEIRANCKTYGEWKRRYPKEYESARKMFSHVAMFRIKNYERWQQFMSSIDISGLSEDDRRAHGELMEAYAKVHGLLKEDLVDDDGRTFEQAEASAKEIGRLEEQAREMMANERGILAGAVAENLGRRLGWQDEDIAALVETLRAIAEVTAKDVQR